VDLLTGLCLQETVGVGQQWAAKQMPKIAAILEERLRTDGFLK